jgi:hypothetical protein
MKTTVNAVREFGVKQRAMARGASRKWLAVAVAFAAAMAPHTWAQDEEGFNILANDQDRGFKPKITFTEVSTDRIVVSRDGADVSYDTAPNPRRIGAVIQANLVQFPFSDIAEDMTVGVTIGGFNFESTLGEDNSRRADRSGDLLPFDPNKTSAIYYLTKEVESPNPDRDPRIVRVGYVKFSWTTRVLTVRVVVADAEGAGFEGFYDKQALIDAAAFDSEKGGATVFKNEPLAVAVTFGSAAGSRQAFGGGVLRTVQRKVGSERAGNAAVLPLNTLVAAGTADIIDPKMDGAIPTTDQDGDGLLSFNGVITDLAPSTLTGEILPVTLRLYIDDSEVFAEDESFVLSQTDPNKLGKSTFTISNLVLPDDGLSHLVAVYAEDVSGNGKLVEQEVKAGGPTR